MLTYRVYLFVASIAVYPNVASGIEHVNRDPSINLKFISVCVRGFLKFRSNLASEPRAKDTELDSSPIRSRFFLYSFSLMTK